MVYRKIPCSPWDSPLPWRDLSVVCIVWPQGILGALYWHTQWIPPALSEQEVYEIYSQRYSNMAYSTADLFFLFRDQIASKEPRPPRPPDFTARFFLCGTINKGSAYPQKTPCKIRFSAPSAIFRGAHRFRDMHLTFQIPYVYDYITKSCRQQAEVIHNHENENVRNIGQGEALHRKYKRLKLGSGHVYGCSSVPW
jgi:hypothetical protein